MRWVLPIVLVLALLGASAAYALDLFRVGFPIFPGMGKSGTRAVYALTWGADGDALTWGADGPALTWE